MDLILWRHAEAEDGMDDLARELTSKGRKQAARMAEWLQRRLPDSYVLVASPAARAQQTAAALGHRVKTDRTLAPGAPVAALLRAAGWPDHGGTVILVGHQPDFGRAAAYLMGANASWSLKKGGLWWLSNRQRDEGSQVVVRAVMSPDLL